MNPKASIILLTYNQAGSVGRAMESILSQRCFFPFEIVVADDGSTDGTRQICEDYARRYPHIVRMLPLEPNKGVVDNYFDAILACRGDYMADCAGDDVWSDSRRLQYQIEWLDSHPGDVAVMSDWDIVTDGVAISSANAAKYECWRRNIRGPEMTVSVLGCRSAFPLLSAMLFRRAPVIDMLHDNPSALRRKEWGCEDLPLVAALGQKGDFGYLPLTASAYTADNQEGISNNRRAGHLFDFYAKAARCVTELSALYRVENAETDMAIRGRLLYLSSLLLHAFTRERLQVLRDLCRDNSRRAGTKIRIYLMLSASAPGRYILRKLKSSFLKGIRF